MTFADALRAAMTARGYVPGHKTAGIKRLAAISRVNPQTITNLLSGVNGPRVETASVLAEVLHNDELLEIVLRDRRRQWAGLHDPPHEPAPGHLLLGAMHPSRVDPQEQREASQSKGPLYEEAGLPAARTSRRRSRSLPRLRTAGPVP
ncbi:MAG: hypothetical protein EPN91_04060 [Salinibacterium sp.]|nr:MAG: hypothetical protein EPN91_04060 [Salinibacterium sp.]